MFRNMFGSVSGNEDEHENKQNCGKMSGRARERHVWYVNRGAETGRWTGSDPGLPHLDWDRG